ncbi:MAG: universal stress protein [Pseudomonadota bacterium]
MIVTDDAALDAARSSGKIGYPGTAKDASSASPGQGMETMRKFMVVIDETPECQKAMRFAARRARNTGGRVLMVYVIPPEEFQHWIGVAEVMRAEAREAAEARLSELADGLTALSGLTPEFSIRVGALADEVMAAIEEDPEIGVLVLGAGDEDGPGPLVSQLVAKQGHRMRVPVTVVPGGLSPERIDAIT